MLSILLLLVIMTSCKVGIVGVRTGASITEISLPSHVKKIYIINRVRPTNYTSAIKIGNAANAKIPGIDDALETINNKLRDGIYLHAYYKNSFESNSSNNLPTPYTKTQLNAMFPYCDSCVGLSIEMLYTGMSPNLPVYFDVLPNTKSYNQNLYNNQSQFKHATYHVPLEIGFRLYNLKDGVILDEFKTSRELVVKAEGPQLVVDTANKFPTYNTELSRQVSSIASMYVDRFNSQPIYASRYYYRKGSDQLKTAAKFIKKRDFKKGIAIYTSMNNNPNPKIASRIMHNLAVCYELDGNVKEALKWYEKSVQTYPNQYATYYISNLRNRID